MHALPVPLARTLRLLPLVALLLSTLPARASAEDDSVRQAREHLSRAKVHYKLGEWDEAIAEFKEAYRLRSVPGLLFNIGQALRMKGDYRQSRFYYQNYLRDQPNAPNRGEVERQLAQLERLIADEEEATANAAAPTPRAVVEPEPVEDRSTVAAREPPPFQAKAPAAEAGAPAQVPASALAPAPEAERSGLRIAPLTLGATSVVLAVASLVAYSGARDEWNDVRRNAYSRADIDERLAAGDRKRTVSLGLAGAAALTGTGAAILFAF